MTEINEEQEQERGASVHGSTAAIEQADTERASNIAAEEGEENEDVDEARELAKELEKIKVKMPTMTV